LLELGGQELGGQCTYFLELGGQCTYFTFEIDLVEPRDKK